MKNLTIPGSGDVSQDQPEVVETSSKKATLAQEEIHQKILEQMSIFEQHEEKNWVDEDKRKSPVLMSLYERIHSLEKSGKNPHAKKAKGREESPQDLAERISSDEDILKKARGEKALQAFLKAVDRPYNLFYIDRNLSKEELEERIAILDQLYAMYKDAPIDERYLMEELINRIFGTLQITDEAQAYMDHLDQLDSTKKSAGAENRNLIFQRHENRSLMFEDRRAEPRVLKISKARHDIDFTSMLKLARNMHVMMLRCNNDVGNLRIRMLSDNITICKDKDTNYKRLVSQPYAKGIPAQEATRKYKDDPSFKEAWVTFLKEMEAMRKTDGVVLDLTNSDAPFPLNRMRPRGNVANTKNVFIHREEDGSWLFSIIDLDVFDTVPGEHKFDPKEYKGVGKNLKAFLVGLMNKGRVTTLGWQDSYVKKELGK